MIFRNHCGNFPYPCHENICKPILLGGAVRQIENWLTDEQQASLYSAEYWNDIEEEKKKEWWIADGDYSRCLNYLQKSGLLVDFCGAEALIRGACGSGLKIADLAAGIGWTSALLSRLPNISEVHAVEISQHRLGVLFEHGVRMMKGDEAKIYRHLGSFYELRFEAESIDLIFLSQAFHHADRPLRLLQECDRVLTQNGAIVLIGEHCIGIRQFVRRLLRTLILEKKLVTGFDALFPPDPVLGDHYYTLSDYRFMFRSMGYKLDYFVQSSGNAMFFARKNGAVI